MSSARPGTDRKHLVVLDVRKLELVDANVVCRMKPCRPCLHPVSLLVRPRSLAACCPSAAWTIGSTLLDCYYNNIESVVKFYFEIYFLMLPCDMVCLWRKFYHSRNRMEFYYNRVYCCFNSYCCSSSSLPRGRQRVSARLRQTRRKGREMASARESVSRFGKFLSSMVIPNIGAFK